jgi:Uma2 family endonuclease
MAVQHAEPTEQRGLTRRLFTVEEYKRMIDAGVFNEDERIELIRGEIVKMPPISDGHAGSVGRLTMQLAQRVGNKAIVWVQNPVELANNERPQPDVTLLKWQDYGVKRPATAADVLLIIEVAETSVRRDRGVKRALYAQAGIPEYWIVNLRSKVIEVYTDPAEGAYRQMRHVKVGDTLTLPAELGELAVGDILGEKA